MVPSEWQRFHEVGRTVIDDDTALLLVLVWFCLTLRLSRRPQGKLLGVSQATQPEGVRLEPQVRHTLGQMSNP